MKSSKITNSKAALSKSRLKFWGRSTPSSPVAPGRNGTGAKVVSEDAPRVNGSIGVFAVTDDDIETRIHFQIKHWVKGRLRVVIPRLAHDEAYGERLQYQIMATSSAFSVRVNPTAQSLVIEYDPQEIEASDVLEHIVICIKDAAKPTEAIEKPAKQADDSEFKINYKKRLGLPAVAMALGVGTLLSLIHI